MRDTRPFRLRASLLATLAALAGIAAAGGVDDRPLPVRVATTGRAPAAADAPSAVAHAAFAAG